jgi:hypothetical protein
MLSLGLLQITFLVGLKAMGEIRTLFAAEVSSSCPAMATYCIFQNLDNTFVIILLFSSSIDIDFVELFWEN